MPATGDWANGLLSVNTPLILLGSLIYLKEFGKCRTDLFAALTVFLFALHCYLAYSFNPGVLVGNFALKSLFIFMVVWILRKTLPTWAAIIFLSDMAYAVYLFHNWTWNPIKAFLQKFFDPQLYPDIQTLAVVFIVSYVMLLVVERPGIRLGQKAIANLKVLLKQ